MVPIAILALFLASFVTANPFSGPKPIRLDQQNDPSLFQGDIELPKGRNGLIQNSRRRWTNGIVYYDWLGGKWAQDRLDMLSAAFRMIEKHTCIKFVKRTNESNFINIENGGICASQVGMAGGYQRVSLMNQNENGGTCWTPTTVIHELLHAIGLWHEHMRYDRDEFLTIREDNMINGAQVQFNMVLPNASYTYGVDYNYKSVMHYGAWHFSGNGEPTMIPKKAGVTVEDVGTGEMWDFESDWEKIRRMYNCQGTYPMEPCDDNYNACDYYKNKCQEEDYNWLKSSCARTCGVCPPGVPTPSPTTPAPTQTPAAEACEDKVNYCAGYLDDCAKLDWLKNYCRKTCGFCTDNCKDELSYCATYADQCGKEPWTKTSCRKTCGLC